MPVLLTGWKPDDITGPDFLNWAALALRPTAAVRDNQRLTERMLVPGGARTWFKRDAGSSTRAGSGAFNSGSTRTEPVKYSAGPLPEGCETLRLISIADLLRCLACHRQVEH